jgi:hypothetical protein
MEYGKICEILLYAKIQFVIIEYAFAKKARNRTSTYGSHIHPKGKIVNQKKNAKCCN